MPVDRSFIESNQRQSERLKRLANSLSDTDLLYPMEAGWTVASVLLHMAFWDRRALTLIEKWKSDGVGESPLDADVINEVTRYFFLSIPPRQAANISIEYGEAINQTLSDLDPIFLEKIATESHAIEIERGKHRAAHLNEIERALGRSR